MKKILHLLASNKFSGAENVACTIIENFEEEFEMAYCSPYGSIEKTLKSKKIKYYGLEKFNRKNLKKVIKQFNPDIIHAHDYKASVLVAFSGFKGKIISHLHNNCVFAKTWNIKTVIYNFSIKKYNKVIGVSDAVYNEAIFKKRLIGKYLTIYNYVDKEKIIKLSNEDNFDEFYDLFFIGRLTDSKKPLLFIKIVKELVKNNNNLKAAMIGDGELKNECIDLINSLSLNDNIELLGFIDNPFPIIKNCNIGIMPSKWEGFGLTAIESLILNKPVLNSGVGGLGEIFKNNQEFICENIDEYINLINQLLNNLELYNEYSEAGKTIVNKFSNIEKWKKTLNYIYNSK